MPRKKKIVLPYILEYEVGHQSVPYPLYYPITAADDQKAMEAVCRKLEVKELTVDIFHKKGAKVVYR